MLVSDDGEADNAGRAVGALARRLGLSGGQLKAIFMAGADSAVAQSVRMRRLERETVRLRERLADAEAAAATLQRERNSLLRETEALQAELTARRQGRRMRWLAAVAVVLMLGGGAALVAWGPKLRLGGEAVAPATRHPGLADRHRPRPPGGAARARRTPTRRRWRRCRRARGWPCTGSSGTT